MLRSSVNFVDVDIYGNFRQNEMILLMKGNDCMKKIMVVHGPNLNLLGLREPDVYGLTTLETLNAQLKNQAEAYDFDLKTIQSQSESELISCIHDTLTHPIDYLIINPAAFTHTSVALRDALLAVKIPFIEVHISNIYARESFRHHSYFSDIALGVISGLGTQVYFLALQAIRNIITPIIER